MKLYTNQDIMEMSGKSTATLTRDRAAGKLGGQSIGRMVIYTQAEVNAYLKGQKPPKVKTELFGIGQASKMSDTSTPTIKNMIADGRVEPITLDSNQVADGRPVYVFTVKLISQIKHAKLDPGRQVIDDGAYDLVDRREDGRFTVAGTTGKDGKMLHYKTHGQAVQMARRAIREDRAYKAGDWVYAKVGAIVNRARMVDDMTSVCLAAWVIVQGTEKPVLVQKRQLKGLVNEEVLDHLAQHNYIVIKDRRDV